MQVYNAPLSEIDKKETLRYAGMNQLGQFPEDILEQACLDAQLLSTPQGIWNVYPYDSESGIIQSTPPFRLLGQSILDHLSTSVQVAIFAVTIGSPVESAISNNFSTGNYTSGLLLDAAASTAVEIVADEVNKIIASQATKYGLTSIQRFSPGYGDWNITDQPNIVTLAGGTDINITVTSSCALEPRKSVTAIIGLIPKDTPVKSINCTLDSCSKCTLKNCMARKEL